MRDKPDLRRIPDFRLEDLKAFPVWRCVRSFDRHEPWYSEVDEITYRPWTEGIYPCSDGEQPAVIVQTQFRLSDGTQHVGFIQPPFTPEQKTFGMDYTQPSIILNDGRHVAFWLGAVRDPSDRKALLYQTLDREPRQVFPIRCRVAPELIDVPLDLLIEGFGWLRDDVVIER